MKCPRPNCGCEAHLLRCEAGPFTTTHRYYLCASQHHFYTVEVYEPQGPSVERNLLTKALRAIQLKFFPRPA